MNLVYNNNTMKDFQKFLWDRNGSNVSYGLLLEKIDQTNRVVVGFATLDNVDYADDIITLDASINAFENFRGNIRVQHDDKRPVGTMIGFQPSTYFDEETQKTYNGIQVAVRISDGAEDVWKMCLDGTLSAFSIAGAVRKAHKVYSEELGRTIQVIDEIMFTELSLVDSPMNRLANVFAIHKSFDYGTMEKGFDSCNLFWCGTDRLASKSKGAELNCPSCGDAMATIGHIDENDEIEKQLRKVFENEMKGGHPLVEDTNIVIEKDIDGEETVAVEEAVVESESEAVEEAVEEVISEETEAPEEEEESEETESEDDTEEEEDKEVERSLEDLLRELHQKLDESLDESRELVSKSHDELKTEFSTLSSDMEKQFRTLAEKNTELEGVISELREKLNNTTDGLEETKKRLDGFVEHTAVKKGLDSSSRTTVATTEKRESLFSGVFTGKQ